MIQVPVVSHIQCSFVLSTTTMQDAISEAGNHQASATTNTKWKRCLCSYTEKCNVEKMEPPVCWFRLFCAFCVLADISLFDCAFPVLYDHLLHRYDITRSTLSWTVSVYVIASTSIGLLSSPLISRHKAGKRLAGVAGAIGLTVGCVGAALAPNVPLFISCFGFICGASVGTLGLLSNVIVMANFDKNRGMASGILALGYSLGTIMSSPLTNHLLETYSLPGALLMFGGLSAQCLVLILSSTIPPTGSDVSKDVSSGEQLTKAEALTPKVYGRQLCDFSLLFNKRFAAFLSVSVLTYVGRFGLNTYSVNKALQLGVPHQQAVLLPSLVGLAGVVVRIPTPIILNFKVVNELLYHALGVAMLAAGLFAFGAATNYSTMAFSMIGLGCWEGFTGSCFPLALVRMVGERNLPKAFALCLTSSAVATFVAMPLTGWMVDSQGDFCLPFYILGSAATGGALIDLILALHRPRKSVSRDQTTEIHPVADIESKEASRQSPSEFFDTRQTEQ